MRLTGGVGGWGNRSLGNYLEMVDLSSVILNAGFLVMLGYDIFHMNQKPLKLLFHILILLELLYVIS